MANALSRRGVSGAHMCVITRPAFDLLQDLRHATYTDPALVGILGAARVQRAPWALVDGIVTFKHQAYVPPTSPLVADLLVSVHDGGHEGVQKLLHHHRQDFHLPEARVHLHRDFHLPEGRG